MTREQVRAIAVAWYGNSGTILDDSIVIENGYPLEEKNKEGYPAYNFAVLHHAIPGDPKEIHGLCHFCPFPKFELIDGKWERVSSDPNRYVCGAD